MPTVKFLSSSSYKVNNTSFHSPVYGNYKFDIDLTYFGVMKERKFRKVNRIQSLLKLREVKDTKSIYPMIDEFGYSFLDFFIFKSTWDYEYSVETVLAKPNNPKNIINNLQVSKDKFFEDSMYNVGKLVQDWEENLDFIAGRPQINTFNNNNLE
jgi:hypothetical protein